MRNLTARFALLAAACGLTTVAALHPTPAAAELSEAQVLYYYDSWYLSDVYGDALTTLGIVPTVAATHDELKTALETGTWDLVVFIRNTNAKCGTKAEQALVDFIGSGGRAIGHDLCGATIVLNAFDVGYAGGASYYLTTTVPSPVWDGIPALNYIHRTQTGYTKLSGLRAYTPLALHEDQSPAVVLGTSGNTIYSSMPADDYADVDVGAQIATQQIEYLLGTDPGPDTVSGTIHNLDLTSLKCTNKATGQSVSLTLGSSFDCEAAGLAVETGQKVQIQATGTVQ